MLRAAAECGSVARTIRKTEQFKRKFFVLHLDLRRGGVAE